MNSGDDNADMESGSKTDESIQSILNDTPSFTELNEKIRKGEEIAILKILSEDFIKLLRHPTFHFDDDGDDPELHGERLYKGSVQYIPNIKPIVDDINKRYRTVKILSEDLIKRLRHPTFHFDDDCDDPELHGERLYKGSVQYIPNNKPIVDDINKRYRTGKILTDDFIKLLRHPTFHFDDDGDDPELHLKRLDKGSGQCIPDIEQLVDDINKGYPTGKILLPDTTRDRPIVNADWDALPWVLSGSKLVMNLALPGSSFVIEVFEAGYNLDKGNYGEATLHVIYAGFDIGTLGAYGYYKTIAAENAVKAGTKRYGELLKNGGKLTEETVKREISKIKVMKFVDLATYHVSPTTITTFLNDVKLFAIENNVNVNCTQTIEFIVKQIVSSIKSVPKATFKTPIEKAMYDGAMKTMPDYAKTESFIATLNASSCGLINMLNRYNKGQNEWGPERVPPSFSPIDLSSALRFRNQATSRESVPRIENPMAYVTKTPGEKMSLHGIQQFQSKVMYSNLLMWTLKIQNEFDKKRTDDSN